MTYFIGIDPGLSGSIGVLDHDGEFYDVRDLPKIELPGNGTVRNRLHGAKLVKLLASIIPADGDAICYVEDVQAWGTKPQSTKADSEGQEPASFMGASTMAAMIGTKMVILAVLDCFESRITVKLVAPPTWKRYFGLKKIVDPSKSRAQITTAFKAASRAKAIEFYPTANIRKAEFDGRAEALLIARFGRDAWCADAGLFDVGAGVTPPKRKGNKRWTEADIKRAEGIPFG